jgi:hypothetical protein
MPQIASYLIQTRSVCSYFLIFRFAVCPFFPCAHKKMILMQCDGHEKNSVYIPSLHLNQTMFSFWIYLAPKLKLQPAWFGLTPMWL